MKTIKYQLSCFLFLFLIACSKEESVPVVADFSIEVVNNDYSVPVQVKITNNTEGADTYKWTFNGATPTASTDKNPGTITYNAEGNYTIKLEASNRDGNSAQKEISVALFANTKIGFTANIVNNNFSPTEVVIVNTTTGASTFDWTFDGGTPATSSQKDPGKIVFTTPGDHVITLEVNNGFEKTKMQQTITVAPLLVADFDYAVAFEDFDMQAPLSLTTTNKSISATSYNWSFVGGNPATTTDTNTAVTFANPGTYNLVLTATNGKDTKTMTKSITVLPNTNLLTFQNLKLGINSAHNNNTIGAFFSAKNRAVYTKVDVTATNGKDIDIAFFGLNKNFTFNKFLSPDEVQTLTFEAIPNATHTKIINSQESCACATALSVTAFDNITNGAAFQSLNITETAGGLLKFDNTLQPRIVLFQTADGRKGAIKIKSYINDNTNSYILVDIKIQKE